MTIGDNHIIVELKNNITISNNKLMDILIEESDLLKSGVMIKAKYILKIGKIELDRYNLQFEYLKLKRMIELYQAAINRQQTISEEEVNKVIIEETIQYQTEIDKLVSDILISKKIHDSKTLSDEDYKLVKDTYRYIVKLIHPDINQELYKKYKSLWEMTTEAYSNNDLKQLLMIKSLIIQNKEVEVKENEIEKLEKILMNINFNIDEVRDRINTIKNDFPFNQVDILEDQNKINEIIKGIYNDIEIYYEYNKELTEIINKLKNQM